MMASPVSALQANPPRCFALISQQISGNTDTYVHSLHADIEDIEKFERISATDSPDTGGGISTNPHARFYFEQSKTPGYLHIRCGYNNKYWVAEDPPDFFQNLKLIKFKTIGTTSEREEDKMNPLCTLFKVDLENKDIDDAGNNIYGARFYTALENLVAVILTREDREDKYSGSLGRRFIIRDLSDHVVLPRYVAFKGDNGKYLSAREVHGRSYCQFSSEDIKDPNVMFTTFHNDDGTVRLKSNAYDKFLRLSPSWIWPDGGDDPNDKDMLFKVIKIDDYFLLKNLGNNRFCKRLNADNKSDCLNAGTETVTTEAKLWVEEPVLSREIYNVVYYGLDKARVYDSKTLNMASSSAINATSRNNNVKINLTITMTQSNTWDSSISTKIGVKSTISAGVPEVASESLEWSAEVETGFSFGKTEVTETKQEIVYEVIVPKMKKVTVSAIATKAKCDVPYSYTQKDIMPSGKVIVSTHHDGMYSGKNTFNLQYVTTEEDLPAEFVKKEKQVQEVPSVKKEKQVQERPLFPEIPALKRASS